MAQPTWKWGRSGGSQVDNFNDWTEYIYDITSDKNGNIYALAKVYAGDLHVDNNSVAGQGQKDILLTSFACDGTYRWSKVIGSDDFDDVGASVKVDTLGGVYVCGNITMAPGTPGSFGDTVIGTSLQSVFLVKFDTAGTYQWLRLPQADTVDVSAHLSKAVDMDVTADGHIRMLTSLAPGAYAGGAYVVNFTGMHIFHYNSTGTYLGAHEMDMNITGLSLANVKMARDHHTGRYYVSGAGYENLGTVFIGGVFVGNAMYAASFDQNGLHSWTQRGYYSDNSLSGFWGRPQIDDSGYVYFSGHTSEADTFANTYAVTNTLTVLGQAYAIPFIAKLDSNANLIWAKHANADEEIQRAFATLRNNDEIVISGIYTGKVEWGGFAGPHLGLNMFLQGNVFTTRINTHTGAVIQNDSLSSDAVFYKEVTAIGHDGKGGVIIGGHFMGSVNVGPDTLTLTGSNEPDFFLARLGENCDAPQNVKPVSTAAQIAVYPNPATAEITITSNQALKNITLTNTLGAIVAQRAVSGSDKLTVDISQLPTGIYFLKATDKQGNHYIEKIMKQ
jgi:hypothetical protein